MSVQVCIPSRDGKFDDEVLTRVHAACAFAAKRGIDCEITRVNDSYSAPTCRNRGVAGFLASEFTHLLFVDDDVLLPESSIHLLGSVGKDGIVCGCVPSVRIDAQGKTTGYVQVKPLGCDWLTSWPTEIVEAESCGGGCMMIPRWLFDKLEFPWFRWPEVYRSGLGIRAISDDGDFCIRALMLDCKIWAIPEVRCGHKKTIDISMLIQ